MIVVIITLYVVLGFTIVADLLPGNSAADFLYHQFKDVDISRKNIAAGPIPPQSGTDRSIVRKDDGDGVNDPTSVAKGFS